MNIKTRFKFTEPLFFDGVAWNYLKYDHYLDKLEAHIVVNSDKIPESYLAFFNIIDKNVMVSLQGNELHLDYDKNNCAVVITIEEKRGFFSRKKYIKSVYRYYPRKIEHIYIPKIKGKLELIGYEKWDTIANFINQIFQ